MAGRIRNNDITGDGVIPGEYRQSCLHTRNDVINKFIFREIN
jgi:hypothetical protein